jgi:hypothetical protein
MSPEQPQQLNPKHQPETVSTSSRQTFDDPEGGVSLDSPLVQAREQQRGGSPSQRRTRSPHDGPDQV